jgi:phosphoglycerate dehydrogenase-like enzyme
VTLLPHVASHTYESQLAAGLMACRNALNFIEGKEPESLLNPDYKNNIK